MKFSRRSLNRLKGVHPLLIAIMVDAIRTSPYDFGIPEHGGRRTDSEQHALYKIGRYGDKRRKITYKDGYRNKSYHQTGLAVDFYAYINGKPNWQPKYYTIIARHIQKVAWEKYHVKLTWGGDWKSFKDLPHLQISRGDIKNQLS